jgi:peptidoglycan hydrolase-like protein with peptidoglycan-binding domain
MKLTHLVVAGTAVLSLGAIATGAQARGDQAQRGAQQGQAQAGHSAEVIKRVQEKLAAAGHDVGPADGIIGARTRQGLQAFQQAKGIEATGQLDQRTLAALGVDAAAATGATPGTVRERAAEPQPQAQEKPKY